MPREPRPWFRTSTGTWYVQIKGQQVALGADKEAAYEDYRLMGRRIMIGPATTAAQIIRMFLDWCGRHKPRSLSWYEHYLDDFAALHGTVKVRYLKPYHVTQWLDRHEWGQTSRSCAIRAIKRPFQWAVDEGILDVSPLKQVKRVKPKRRETIITPDQWDAIFAATKDQAFAQFLTFLRETGCRPQEARAVEARHLKGGVLVLPADEAKGGIERKIVLNDRATALIANLVQRHPSGPLLRNTQGKPWSKSAVMSRFRRLRARLGIVGLTAYVTRHTWATEALLRGLNPLEAAKLMGHTSVKMLSEVYEHLDQHTDYLKEMARRARGESGPNPAA